MVKAAKGREDYVMEIRISIGRKLSELRKAKGMTQRELSKITGINSPYIANIERGRYSVGHDVLVVMLSALGAKISILPS